MRRRSASSAVPGTGCCHLLLSPLRTTVTAARKPPFGREAFPRPWPQPERSEAVARERSGRAEAGAEREAEAGGRRPPLNEYGRFSPIADSTAFRQVVRRFAFQRGVMVASRSQLGLPA